MSLSESIIEDAALEWFLLRQGFGGQVGDQPSPRLPLSFSELWRTRRRTGLGYAVGYGAAFAGLGRAKPQLAPGEPEEAERDPYGEVVQSRVARTLTRPLPNGEERRRGQMFGNSESFT